MKVDDGSILVKSYDEDELKKFIKREYKRLQDVRKEREDERAEAAAHAYPERNMWDRAKGLKRYDSSAQKSMDIAVAVMLSNTCSPMIEWYKPYAQGHLNTADDVPYLKDALEDRQKSTDTELQDGSFYRDVEKVYRDALSSGSGAMMVFDDPKTDKITYKVPNPDSWFFDVDDMRQPDEFFLEYTLNPWIAEERFSNTLPEELKPNDDKTYQEVEILQCIFPASRVKGGKKFRNKYFSVHVLADKEYAILSVSHFKSFPVAVFVFQDIDEDPYGTCWAIKALPDIRYANETVENNRVVGTGTARPPVAAPASFKGRLRLGPGQITYYDAAENPDAIKSINLNQNYAVTQDMLSDIKEEVRDHFHINQMLSLQTITKQMTVVEVSQRLTEASQVLGPTLISFQTTFANPVVLRVMDLLDSAGKLEKMPDGAEKQNIKIRLIGPFAQILRSSSVRNGITQGLSFLAGLNQAIPEAHVMDYVDVEYSLREGLTSFQFPEKAIKEKNAVKKIQEERKAAEAQLAQQQQQLTAAKMFKDVSTAPQAGSPAEIMMGGAV